jgi:HlyD family secretion protein
MLEKIGALAFMGLSASPARLASTMPRTWRYLVALAAALVVAGGFYYWQTTRTISLAVASVEKNVEVRVFGIGTMEAQVVSKIGFQVAGKLTEVSADQGDFVAAGALLAKLDDSAQRAKLAKTEATVRQTAANLLRAQALRDRAQVTYQQKKNVSGRRQSLAGRGAVSQEAAEDAQAAEDIAQSELKVAESDAAVAAVLQDDAKAQRDIEAVTLSQHELRAPFAARVIARLKELGSVASPGEPVFTLIVPESIWARAYVDEALAGGLQPGQTAYVRLRSEPGNVVEAEVVRIDQESDRVTEERRVYVRCRSCKAEHQVRFLGEQAEVEIVKKTVASGRFVPLRLVEGYDGRSGTIWVIENGSLAKRNVELGDRLLDGRVEITSTLPAATQVVIEGRADLQEGRAARPAAGGS